MVRQTPPFIRDYAEVNVNEHVYFYHVPRYEVCEENRVYLLSALDVRHLMRIPFCSWPPHMLPLYMVGPDEYVKYAY